MNASVACIRHQIRVVDPIGSTGRLSDGNTTTTPLFSVQAQNPFLDSGSVQP